MLAQPLPESVVANTPFDVHLKMINKYGEIIDTSFNSGLEIMAQVSYTHKWFERSGGLWLVQTDAVLAGPDVVSSVINDKVIFKRFVKGVVRSFKIFFFFYSLTPKAGNLIMIFNPLTARPPSCFFCLNSNFEMRLLAIDSSYLQSLVYHFIANFIRFI